MNSPINYSNIERITYSRQFRNLQDKTQLFYSSTKRRVRTRLTHTIEVKIVAYNIAQQINKKLKDGEIDLNLVDAIALAHDIGHTPFGHIGERTIDSIVAKKDNLGGLLDNSNPNKMRFKHNVNSMRILDMLKIQDWRIVDGALCHTKVFYKNDSYIYSGNPYIPYMEDNSKMINFICEQHKIFFNQKEKNNPHSLTLEGQIVSIADEVAQRVADISDGLESRYFEIIKRIIAPKCKIKSRDELEKCIRDILIDDVVSNTIENVNKYQSEPISFKGISHNIYTQRVVCFSSDIQLKNDQLEKYIKTIMAQCEDVRESDSRSKYIIRQLYKAYVNDVSLLPDEFIDEYFCKLINKDTFSKAIAILESQSAESEDEDIKGISNAVDIFNKIKQQGWRVNKRNLPQNTLVVEMDLVNSFFKILTKENKNLKLDILKTLYDEYILKIGFYIADLTNTEAFSAYNRIYGH